LVINTGTPFLRVAECLMIRFYSCYFPIVAPLRVANCFPDPLRVLIK
jgi:hypothetical protein